MTDCSSRKTYWWSMSARSIIMTSCHHIRNKIPHDPDFELGKSTRSSVQVVRIRNARTSESDADEAQNSSISKTENCKLKRSVLRGKGNATLNRAARQARKSLPRSCLWKKYEKYRYYCATSSREKRSPVVWSVQQYTMGVMIIWRATPEFSMAQDCGQFSKSLQA